MVHFVGAGSGAADLITVRGARLLGEADVVIYAGSLVNPALLSYTKPGCEIHNSAKMTLEEVIAVIRAAEAAGKTTVRLHTGDSSIYGAVREQFDELEALFRVLAEKNMRWICCSNAARPYQKAWGLIAATASKVNCPIYADPVWSFERGCKKPDTQMFDQCLHMLDSAPQRAWMVGDTFSHDISGAMRAGFAGALHLVRD